MAYDPEDDETSVDDAPPSGAPPEETSVDDAPPQAVPTAPVAAPPAPAAPVAAPAAPPAPVTFDTSAVNAGAGVSGPRSLPTPDTALPTKKKEEDDDGVFGALGHAIHGGIMNLQSMFGLSDKDAAVRDPERYRRGQQGLQEGYGAGSPEDMKAVAKAIDPDDRLTHAQMMLQAMTKGYEHFMQGGDEKKANNLAAMIIQYANHEASMYASQALSDLHKGDLQGAGTNLGYATENMFGKTYVGDTKPNGKGGLTVPEKDVVTDKVVNTHDISGQQLYSYAMGIANKSLVWQGLMDAAASRPGQQKAPKTLSQAAIDAIGSVNPDTDDEGIPRNLGGGPAQAGGGAVTRQGNMPTPVDVYPESKEQFTAMMPGFRQIVRAGESGGKNLPASEGHKAAGVYQIQPDTWKQITGHDPVVNGKDERLDEGLSEQVFQKLTQANAVQFEKSVGRMPSMGELALMHQQGAGGAISMIQAAEKNPNTAASDVVPAANLAANGVPKDATVADAVRHIQNYYLKYNAPDANRPVQVASNTVAAPMTDAGSAAALPGGPQAVPTAPVAAPPGPAAGVPGAPSAPQAAPPAGPVRQASDLVRPGAIAQGDQLPVEPTETAVPVPNWAHIQQQRLAGLTPQETNIYKATVKDRNALLTKGYLDQKKVNNDTWKAAMADHRAKLKELTGETAKPLVFKDRAEAMNIITPVVQDMAKEPDFSKLSPAGQKSVPDATFGIAAANNDLTPAQAARIATNILLPGVAPNKDGSWNYSVPFKASKMPNPNLTRVQLTDGRKLVVPTNTYNEMMQARGNEISIMKTRIKAAQDKGQRWEDVVNSGIKLVNSPSPKYPEHPESIGQEGSRYGRAIKRGVSGLAKTFAEGGAGNQPRAVSDEDPYISTN